MNLKIIKVSTLEKDKINLIQYSGYCMINLITNKLFEKEFKTDENSIVNFAFMDYDYDKKNHREENMKYIESANKFLGEIKVKEIDIMFEQKELYEKIIELENQNTYNIIWVSNYKSKKYAYLLNLKDYSDLLFCELMGNNILRKITEKEELLEVINQINWEIITFAQ